MSKGTLGAVTGIEGRTDHIICAVNKLIQCDVLPYNSAILYGLKDK